MRPAHEGMSESYQMRLVRKGICYSGKNICLLVQGRALDLSEVNRFKAANPSQAMVVVFEKLTVRYDMQIEIC